MNAIRRIHNSDLARLGRRAVAVVGWLVVAAGALLLLLPALFGYERYVITGGSMSPAFERGSIVVSERIPVADLAVGDIITYVPPPGTGVTQLVTHRITDITVDDRSDPAFTTQGDANASPDPWTFTLDEPEHHVVRHSIPLVGWVLIALADPQVRLVVIGIPAGIIALQALRDLIVALRSDRRPATGDAGATATGAAS